MTMVVAIFFGLVQSNITLQNRLPDGVLKVSARTPPVISLHTVALKSEITNADVGNSTGRPVPRGFMSGMRVVVSTHLSPVGHELNLDVQGKELAV